ncbi:MAG: hypothetical protein DPW09_04400 [Anaerolineae bacterium]|nr:hypothetical protein [Anaerolineales bacterium]MCQ3972671.1 hypothetical protein [Anaerolineae bacterium]
MSEFVTNLDLALDRLRRGEAPATILTDYPAQAESLHELLLTALTLDTLRAAPQPAAADMAADREQFLAELNQLTMPGVSAGPVIRLKKWIAQHPLLSLIQSNLFKEQKPMNTLLVKAMLILTLVFGAGSGTAVVSAHSLPGEPLYPLKIGLEEARLAVTTDPVQQASQWQERVRERTLEITQMAVNGQTISEAELTRLQTQTQTCLQQLANLPETTLEQQLAQFQQMAQQQQQMLEQAGGDQAQTAAQTMIQARQAAKDGLLNPAAFRYRYGQHRPDEAPPQPTQSPIPTEAASPTIEPTLAPTNTPVRPRHTPQPTGDAHRYGPQPTQPGPGQPGGNPEGQNTPAGDANRYGPQPTQPGPGLAGGNPEATCTPTGDANRYGPQPTQPGPGQPGGNPEATYTPTGEANRYGSPPATPQPGGNSDNSGGSDNAGGAGGSGDSGSGSNGSDNSGGSGDAGGGSNGSGGSSEGGSGSSGEGGDSGDSGSSSNGSGGSSDSGGDSDGSGGGGDSGNSGGSGKGNK